MNKFALKLIFIFTNLLAASSWGTSTCGRNYSDFVVRGIRMGPLSYLTNEEILTKEIAQIFNQNMKFYDRTPEAFKPLKVKALKYLEEINSAGPYTVNDGKKVTPDNEISFQYVSELINSPASTLPPTTKIDLDHGNGLIGENNSHDAVTEINLYSDQVHGNYRGVRIQVKSRLVVNDGIATISIDMSDIKILGHFGRHPFGYNTAKPE